MKKTFLFLTLFLVISFSLAQTTQVDTTLLKQLIEVLQKLVQGGGMQPSQPSTLRTDQTATCPLIAPDASQGLEMCLKSAKVLEEKYPGCKYIDVCYKSEIQPPTLESKESKVAPLLPRGVQSAIPEAKPITPEVLKPILPDENREDDIIVQINNLRITRIINNPTSDTQAVFFAVRDTGWKCMRYESEESTQALPCAIDVRRPIIQKELAIKITDETILLLRNRQRAKLEDFKVNDKINVYGFMDKDNFGIEALIVRNLGISKPILTPPILMPPTKPPISTTSPAINSISGYLTKAEVSIYMWGTHQLKGDDGNVYQIKANNVETSALLDKYSGKRVKIYGKVEYQTIEGGFWSILVEKVEPEKIESQETKSETKSETRSTIQTQSLTQTQSIIESKVEADDYGFYPSFIEVSKGSTVILTFIVRDKNVYYGGLDFRSDKFKTDPVKPGQTTTVKFIADQDFVVSSYWPLSNVKKADLKIIVK